MKKIAYLKSAALLTALSLFYLLSTYLLGFLVLFYLGFLFLFFLVLKFTLKYMSKFPAYLRVIFFEVGTVLFLIIKLWPNSSQTVFAVIIFEIGMSAIKLVFTRSNKTKSIVF